MSDVVLKVAGLKVTSGVRSASRYTRVGICMDPPAPARPCEGASENGFRHE